MGSQIAIVQSAQDERDLVSFLGQRNPFLALPRVIPHSHPVPAELGTSTAEKQVFFLVEEMEMILAHIRPIGGQLGEYQVDRVRTSGLVIEWNRTVWEHPGEAQPGRFYLQRPLSPVSDASRIMERTFHAIQAWTKRTSPMRSDERYPMYVGADLWTLIRNGRARIVHPNGSEVKLVENA